MAEERFDPNAKLLVPEGDSYVAHEWGNGFQFQTFRWGKRVLCSTSGDRISFLLRLAQRYPGPFSVCYILEDDAGTPQHRRGRYWAPFDVTSQQVEYFLNEFSRFIRGDGRHNVMIACESTKGKVIYDQHDYYFVYGQLESLLDELRELGYVERTYDLGIHTHRFMKGAGSLEALMKFWPWLWAPLEAVDTSSQRVSRWTWLRMKLRAWWLDRFQGKSE